MADLLQKVFIILVRPYYTNASGNKTFYEGSIYGDLIPDGNGSRYALITNNATGDNTSPNKINNSGNYKKDPWFLHSSCTSYNKFQEVLKDIIAVYGTDNVKCAIYVPIDYQVIPNQ